MALALGFKALALVLIDLVMAYSQPGSFFDVTAFVTSS